ncbi:MAG: hypothetical protein O3A01_03400 [bacterium]|nr:hypothetical protein [bacterium]
MFLQCVSKIHFLATKPIDGVKGVLFTCNSGVWSTNPNCWQPFSCHSAKPDLNLVCKILSELKREALPIRQFSTVKRFVAQDDPAGPPLGGVGFQTPRPVSGAAAAGATQRTVQLAGGANGAILQENLGQFIHTIMTDDRRAISGVLQRVTPGTRISELVNIYGVNYALYKLSDDVICLGVQGERHSKNIPNGVVFNRSNHTWSLADTCSDVQGAHDLTAKFLYGNVRSRGDIPTRFLLSKAPAIAAQSLRSVTSEDPIVLTLFRTVYTHFSNKADFSSIRPGRPVCSPVEYQGGAMLW